MTTPHWLVRGTLLDNLWEIQVGDASHQPLVTIDFDQPLTPWPDQKSLTHPSFELDLITAKRLFVLGLKPKPTGWVTSSKAIRTKLLNNYLDFVRWRVDRGVASNSLLNAAWFNEYDRSLKQDGREGLLNLAQRAKFLLQNADAELLTLCADERGDASGTALAKLLGVSTSSITPKAHRYIEGWFNEHNRRHTRHSRDRRTEPPNTQMIVNTAVRRQYKVWFDLWRLRDYLAHDPLGYRAFRTRRALTSHIRNFFPDPVRTGDAPAYQTSYLINAALKLVLDPVAQQMVELVKAGVDDNGVLNDKLLLNKCNKRLAQLGYRQLSRYYHLRQGQRVEETTLHQMVFRILPMAARIITATFSARRDDEIHSSAIDCISRDELHRPWLNCFISKNMKQEQRIPIPESVVVAVNLVKEIRNLGDRDSKRLYAFWCPIRSRNVYFSTSKIMSSVCQYFEIPPMDDGSTWKFRPHQLRKFFGVTYFWRYTYPNLTALTFHYRHFNPDTTRGYIEMEAAGGLRINDEKNAAEDRISFTQRKVDFDSSKESFVTWVLRGAAEGHKLDGKLGKRLMGQVEELRLQFAPEMQITGGRATSRSFDEELAHLVSKTSLLPHPEGHSLCGWGTGPDEVSVQRCASRCLDLRQNLTGQSSADATGPDFAYAEDTGCLICPLRVALPSMAPLWEEKVQDAERALAASVDEQARLVSDRLSLLRA